MCSGAGACTATTGCTPGWRGATFCRGAPLTSRFLARFCCRTWLGLGLGLGLGLA